MNVNGQPTRTPQKILALDTSTHRESLALMADTELIGEVRGTSSRTHSARLLESLDFLLRQVAWGIDDLTLLCVGIGPGSFTGIRIGVSTALGLAHSLKIPLAGVSGLDALAYQSSRTDGRLGVVLDAQRGQVYYAEYQSAGGEVRCRRKAGLWFPADLARSLGRGKILLVGDGAVLHAGTLRIRPGGPRRLIREDIFLAPAIARLALSRKRSWRQGERLRGEALYIRPPDALRKRYEAAG